MEDHECTHSEFIGGICTTCQKRVIDCQDYIDRDLRATLDRKKLNLVLDLDNTLLHSKNINELTKEVKLKVESTNPKELYEVEGGSRLVKLRPGARAFLKKARAMYDLSIYTLGVRAYAHEMAGLLVKGTGRKAQSMFKRIISRENCTIAEEKGLDVVLSSKQIVLIVDDRVDVWEDSCKDNVIRTKPYWFFTEEKVKKKVNKNISHKHEKEKMDKWLKMVLKILTSVYCHFYDDIDKDRGQNYMQRDARQILRMVIDSEETKPKKKKDTQIDLRTESKKRWPKTESSPVARPKNQK